MFWKGRLICEAAFFVFLTRDWDWSHYHPCVMAEGHPRRRQEVKVIYKCQISKK